MQLEIVQTDPAFACGVLGPVVVTIWRRPPTEAAVARAQKALDECAARISGSFAYVAIVEPTSPPPTAPVRARMEAHFDGHASLTTMVAVLEDQPWWLGWGLDIAHWIVAPRARRWRAKVCVDTIEGISWLSRQTDPAVPPELRTTLESGIASLRATLPGS